MKSQVRREPLALYFCIFIVFLTSMGLWIGWNERAKYIYAFFGICMIALIKVNHVRLNFSIRNKWSIILLIISYTYIAYKDELIGFRTPFAFYIPISVLILIDTDDRVRCLNYIYKWYAYLLVPSIFIYLMVQSSGLPAFGRLLVNDNNVQPLEYLWRENYIFYNYADFYEIRFNGPFIEPGHLGMMSAFLLLITGYRFKQIHTWIIIVGILLSMSLSGYMLALIGYVLYKCGQGYIKLKNIISFLIFLLLVVYIAFTYNDGENLFYEMIISRLEPDEDTGFVGNNRVFGSIELYFITMFDDTKLLLFGYDNTVLEVLAESGSRGTGFTMWFVKYGLVGTIFASVFYVYYFFTSKSKKKAFTLLAFVIIMFWQRSYPFWFSWIICYVYGMMILEQRLSGEEERTLSKKN